MVIISLEANIGAGKSTLVDILEEFDLPYKFIKEPTHIWERYKDDKGNNILQLYYKDPERWGYTFQNMTLITRGISILKKSYFPKIFVERSILADKNCFARTLHESGTINNLENKIYEDWFETLGKQFNIFPDRIIYLKTTPETCYERVHKRARAGEELVSIDYLTKIHNKHEKWLQNSMIPVLEIDGNIEFENNVERKMEILEMIRTFIG